MKQGLRCWLRCFFVVFLMVNTVLKLNAEALPVELLHQRDAQKVDILVGGNYFTSYLYGHTLLNKPVLFPVLSATGKTVTRGYPIDTRAGERVDHTHHHGIWFNHGDVNGIDFWNAGRTPPKPGVRYGKIKHRKIQSLQSGAVGKLSVVMEWFSDKGDSMLLQETTYLFQGTQHRRSITHFTRLKSTAGDITFNDSKEGVFGIRVARALELPSNKPTLLTGKNLKVLSQAVVDKTGVTGAYRNSEGLSGYPLVWGKRARWMQLGGTIENTPVSIVIFDAPSNVNHPPHWMARDYGLFAVNPLGSAIYTEGKETLNYTLSKGDTLSFKHQLVISDSVELNSDTLEQWYAAFVKQ